MARSRTAKTTTDIGVEVFIPLTRMNFVAFMDAGLFAAPVFLKSRQRYDDVLCSAEDVLVGFSEPVHDSSGWLDGEEIMNFPLVAKVTIPASWIRPSTAKKKARRRATFAVSPFEIIKVVPVERLVEVFTPGSITAQMLSEDPFLENVSIKITPIANIQSAALELVLPSLNGAETTPTHAQLEQELRCIAAIVACSSAVQGCDWEDIWQRFSSAEPFLTTAIRFLAVRSTPAKSDDACWLPQGDLFFSDLLDVSPSAQVLDRYLKDGPSTSLRELDYAAMVALGRILMNEGANAGSIETAISKLRTLLQTASSNHPMYATAIERIERGLDLAEGIAAGVRSPEELFNHKTEWARSVRACGILLLRSGVPDLVGWSASEKPKGAMVEDVYLACVLSGLHTGFTRLPRRIKSQYSSLLYAIGGLRQTDIVETRETRSSIDLRSQWQFAYVLRQGSIDFKLAISGETSSLWAAFKARLSQQNEQALRDLLVYRMSEILMERAGLAAKVFRRDGCLAIDLDTNQVIDIAKQDKGLDFARIAAIAFDREFGLRGNDLLSELMVAADQVLRGAENLLTKSLGKNTLILSLLQALAQERWCPRPCDKLRKAVSISRLFEASLKPPRIDFNEASTKLLKSSVCELV